MFSPATSFQSTSYGMNHLKAPQAQFGQNRLLAMALWPREKWLDIKAEWQHDNFTRREKALMKSTLIMSFLGLMAGITSGREGWIATDNVYQHIESKAVCVDSLEAANAAGIPAQYLIEGNSLDTFLKCEKGQKLAHAEWSYRTPEGLAYDKKSDFGKIMDRLGRNILASAWWWLAMGIFGPMPIFNELRHEFSENHTHRDEEKRLRKLAAARRPEEDEADTDAVEGSGQAGAVNPGDAVPPTAETETPAGLAADKPKAEDA